ncbi:hypothetical protein FKM82_025108 [Ascaphus truei]
MKAAEVTSVQSAGPHNLGAMPAKRKPGDERIQYAGPVRSQVTWKNRVPTSSNINSGNRSSMRNTVSHSYESKQWGVSRRK